MHVQSFYLEPQQEKNRQLLKNQKMTNVKILPKARIRSPFIKKYRI